VLRDRTRAGPPYLETLRKKHRQTLWPGNCYLHQARAFPVLCAANNIDICIDTRLDFDTSDSLTDKAGATIHGDVAESVSRMAASHVSVVTACVSVITQAAFSRSGKLHEQCIRSATDTDWNFTPQKID